MTTEETLTEEEMDEIAELFSMDQWRGDAKKLANTIKVMEERYTSSKVLAKFINPGVLVNDRLVLYADPGPYEYGIGIRAFNEGQQVQVTLTVKEAERMSRLLKDAKEAAMLVRRLNKLKELQKVKTIRRRY